MLEAMRECFIEDRPVTMLGTLASGAERLRYYWLVLVLAARDVFKS